MASVTKSYLREPLARHKIPIASGGGGGTPQGVPPFAPLEQHRARESRGDPLQRRATPQQMLGIGFSPRRAASLPSLLEAWLSGVNDYAAWYKYLRSLYKCH
jgi:hypothetical protein